MNNIKAKFNSTSHIAEERISESKDITEDVERIYKRQEEEKSIKSISKVRENFRCLNHDQIYWGQVKPLRDVMLIDND